MNEAVIVDAIRSPLGRRDGKLAGWHAADLAGVTFQGLASRTGIDPALVNDVVMGCATQVGEQSVNIGRNSVLAAGWPDSVPASTIDRQCGSSQQAVHFAAQGVMAGAYDLVVAAGVEVMSRTPMGAAITPGTNPLGPAVVARYSDRGGWVGQGLAADAIAETYSLDREALDEFAARSHRLAEEARDHGRFEHEILPVAAKTRDSETGKTLDIGEVLSSDEGIRAGATAAGLAKLRPAFAENGTHTAATSSQISDGASAVLIASEARANELGLVPRARFVAFALAGVDPIAMLTGPIPATIKVLERAGLTVDDIDLFEVNEAFASVVLSWQAELKPDESRVNVNGGAIALGHPLGCSGTRLLATMVHELERSGGRFGLQVMCEGGGMANATIIENLQV